MDIIVAMLIAGIIAVPYRHMKIRYRLRNYDNSENCFYGSDEMAKAYEVQLQKIK